jgi:fructose/tagatose bisphosphate aldolase
MAFVSLRQVLDHAAEHGYGVPAFNVNNLEQIQAIMEAAQETTARSSCRPRPAPANTLARPTCGT